ncbi:MAG: hypothetical protein ACJAVS_000837 [Paracoccaceae bacterium]|jgi:hypothetical protein
MRHGISNANAAFRQVFGLALTAALAVSGPLMAHADPAPILEVAKTASCGCCHAWVDRMHEAGFDVRARNVDHGALTQTKISLGITVATASCHTAVIDGYVIEGHVPAADIRRLLAEAPKARGLSVPGMPIGSPGMESGDSKESYDVVLIAEDGSLSTFSHHE